MSLSHKYHGFHGEQAVSNFPYVTGAANMIMEAYREKGIPPTDINGPDQYGADFIQWTVKLGERMSTNNAFIQPIRYKRKNLTVKIQSEVCKILICEKNIAYGVQYKKHGKLYTAYAKKEIIISAGSINSPKLLMLSGVGPKEHLTKLNIRVKKDLAVGKNLHDHATFNAYLVTLNNKTSTLVDNKQVLKELCKYNQKDGKNGLLAYGNLGTTLAFLKSDPSLPAPDVQIHVGGANFNEFVNEQNAYGSLRIFPTAFYDSIYPRFTYLTPKSRGLLLLNESNPNGPPLLYSGYYKDPADMIPIFKIAKFYLTLEDTEAFKSRDASFDRTLLPACKDYEWGSDEYTGCLAKAYTATAYHPVGSCKMGPKTDKKAVVDPKLRVYGISRLRVIDSSIMPTITSGNTNAPSIMIGERGVAFILKKWLRQRKCLY